MKIYKQETDKSCGIACIRSIINSYGNDYSEKDIWAKHKSYKTKDSIMNPVLSLGITALKFGFNVTYFGYHPILTNNNTSKNLKKSLKQKIEKYHDFGKYYINEALDFMELGGKIKINSLNISTLKQLIDKEKYLIVQAKAAYLNKKGSIHLNHKIIIIGYNNNSFIYLDPSDAKKHSIDFDMFLLAFYSAFPELLIIRPK